MAKSFEEILNQVKSCSKKKVSVAVAQDENVLEAVKEAKERGIADSVLVGDADQIKVIADSIGMNLADYEVIDVKDVTEAALTAVKLVHDGKADMYMKGLIDTKGFLKSVLNKEVGLRTGKPLSHVCVFDVKGIDHLLIQHLRTRLISLIIPLKSVRHAVFTILKLHLWQQLKLSTLRCL